MLVDYIWVAIKLSDSWIFTKSDWIFVYFLQQYFEIIKNAPIVSLGFVILIAINLLVAYFQLSILFIGARQPPISRKRLL